MKRIAIVFVCIFMVLAAFSGCGNTEEVAESSGSSIDGVFSVGYGKTDITPQDPVSLAGFSDMSERISNDIMDPIYATCTAITDAGGTTVLLFGLDLLATDDLTNNQVRERLTEKAGIPADNIMFFASHTHSSVYQGSGNPNNAKFNQYYVERCQEAAEIALADRKPAQMEGAFIRPENLNYRRHYVLADGTYQAYHLGEVDSSLIYGHLGRADNLLQVIKFTREGGCDVMMINWQAHYASATRVNYYGISADYPGVLRNELKEQLGCETIFFLGGSGNVTSSTRIIGEPERESYIDQGKQLAAQVVKAAESFKPLATGKIHITRSDYTIPGSEKIQNLYTLGFGEFGCAFSPFEIFDMHAQAVRESSPYKFTFYASCANHSRGNGYLPHEDSFNYYCYEADTTRYPKGAGEAIRDELTRMIQETFQKSGQAAQTRDEGYMDSPYEPRTNGVTYTNPAPGALPITEGENGYYCATVLANGNIAYLLFKDRALADKVAQMTTFQLIFDDYNTVVGIVE